MLIDWPLLEEKKTCSTPGTCSFLNLIQSACMNKEGCHYKLQQSYQPLDFIFY